MAMPEARGGGLGLPTGFRFMPTDEELTASYLRKKALSFPAPSEIIPIADLARPHPPSIPPAYDKMIQFRDETHGVKFFFSRSTLVFFTVNVGSGATRRTQWIMHEYRLHPALLAVVAKVGKDVEDSVVCRFFKKATRRGGNPEDMGGPSSPHLSCVTEELGDDEEEMASSNN
ncbi:hypothetical protein BRADI_4g22216v3 [Brachypodium distachyon]|uniref:NAC domain-containing protein n=1 Tax=Brachypodium distachyon TaxID=15368 RepID=A0A2K2CPH9_BRADI|nr:hypothetical protein BRADI_4g22216v3 [Brachypodium distachyon]